ncbi:MAG: hypothetical protein ACTSU4_01675 [Promethearchaeota archaeon]
MKNTSKKLINFIEYKRNLGFNVHLIIVEQFKNKTGQGFRKKMKEKQETSNTYMFVQILQSILSFTFMPIVLISLMIFIRPNFQKIIKWDNIPGILAFVPHLCRKR